MGIQDDYFDVESALHGKPEAEQFARIWDWACAQEAKVEKLADFKARVLQAGAIIRQIVTEGEQ